MEHFVTLFNSNFLPQGISLYFSMEKHIKNFKLWVLCIDKKCYDILNTINLQNLQPLLLENFETVDLLKAKSNRNFTEYCWTLTPFSFKIVFSLDSNIDRVTYLDADMFFFDSPCLIFKEFEKTGKSVLITKHNYSPFYDYSRESGKYCVQFLIISRVLGEEVRSDWEIKCLDWCYNKFEDGKFGDQKYLDAWTKDFNDKVHVLSMAESILAPWNILKYATSDIIIYHFHGLRIMSNKNIFIGNYLIPKPIYKYIYLPYIIELRKVIKILEEIGYKETTQLNNSFFIYLKSFMSVPYFVLKLIKYSHIINNEKA
jgi:hypothetical protein